MKKAQKVECVKCGKPYSSYGHSCGKKENSPTKNSAISKKSLMCIPERWGSKILGYRVWTKDGTGPLGHSKQSALDLYNNQINEK